MSEPYFIWNGLNSMEMGLLVTDFPAICRAKERVTTVTVPGRSGNLTITDGTDVYESYLRTLKAVTMPGANIHDICAWLRGSSTVIFGNEADYAYTARITNQVSFDKLYNGGYYELSIPFYCQPLKQTVQKESDITITASGTTISNPGDVASRPIITLMASDTDTIVLTVGSSAVTIIGLKSGESIILDWDMMDARLSDGVTNANSYVTGNAQTIPTGDSFVSWTGSVSKVVISPNWRYL